MTLGGWAWKPPHAADHVQTREWNDMPCKTYGRQKAILYISGNVGVIIWAGLYAVQAPTVLRAVLTFILPIVFMNLLIGYLFKAREKADGNEIRQ